MSTNHQAQISAEEPEALPIPASCLGSYNLLGQIRQDQNTTLDAYPRAPMTTATTNFRRIGVGNCGSVWTYENASFALKRADGSETRYLWKEYCMQTRLLEAFSRMRSSAPTVRVPRCYWYTNPSDSEWWTAQLPQFPVIQGSPSVSIKQQPSDGMCSERVPPVAKELRDMLIDRYCPPPLRDEIRHSVANSDCLARLYLGRRRTHTRLARFFSLRNCPILLDQAEELELPIFRHAEDMADALAAMHW